MPRSQKNTTDAGQKSQSIKTEPATRWKIESEDKNFKTVIINIFQKIEGKWIKYLKECTISPGVWILQKHSVRTEKYNE